MRCERATETGAGGIPPPYPAEVRRRRRGADTIRGVRKPRDIIAAGVIGAAPAGIPSTAYSLINGDDVLEGGRAAGAIVLPNEARTPVLLAAGAVVHLAISLGWAAVLAAGPAAPPRARLRPSRRDSRSRRSTSG